MNRKVVILLSDKRSGSTMLQRELCRHPDVSTVDYSPHTYLETHHWLKSAVVLRMKPEMFADGRVYNGYGSWESARTYLVDGILGNVPDFVIPESDIELAFQGWEAICEKFSSPVFFEKSPQLLAHWAALDLLLQWRSRTSFDVKLIGLIRNPMAVSYSAQELFHTDPRKRQYSWRRNYENLERVAEIVGDDLYMLRYEDLVGRTAESFDNLCEFIGIERMPQLGDSISDNSIEKWRTDPDFYFELDETVGKFAGRYRYPPEELANIGKKLPPLIARARRRCVGMAKLGWARIRDRILTPIQLRRKWR